MDLNVLPTAQGHLRTNHTLKHSSIPNKSINKGGSQFWIHYTVNSEQKYAEKKKFIIKSIRLISILTFYLILTNRSIFKQADGTNSVDARQFIKPLPHL